MSQMTTMLNPVMRHLNHWEMAPRKGSKGSGSTTTTSETRIHDDFKPTVNNALAELESLYESGDLGQVAGTSDIQDMVFGRAEESLDKGLDVMDLARGTYEDAMAGTGLFDPTSIDELESAAIDQAKRSMGITNDNIAKAGVMGSSRAQIMAGDQQAQLANALAGLKFDQRNRVQERAMWGADSMMTSGSGEAELLSAYLGMGDLQRGIEQEQLDASAKGLENYLTGIQTFAPLMTTQVQKSESTQKSKGK